MKASNFCPGWASSFFTTGFTQLFKQSVKIFFRWVKDLNCDYITESGSLGLFIYSLAVYDAVLITVSTCLYRNLLEL